MTIRNYPINNIPLKSSISQAIEESFLILADTISDILTQHELNNKDDHTCLQAIMSENDLISAYLDHVLSAHLMQILEELD